MKYKFKPGYFLPAKILYEMQILFRYNLNSTSGLVFKIK